MVFLLFFLHTNVQLNETLTNSGSVHLILGVVCSVKVAIELSQICGREVVSVLLRRFLSVLTWSQCIYNFILVVQFNLLVPFGCI